MYIMTSRPRTHFSVQAPFGGVTDWYQSQVIENQVMAAPVPVVPKVGAAAVASPVGVLELDTYSSSKADPLENDLELDNEIPERHVSHTLHDAMLTRWRSRIASRSSSPTTSTPEIPTALILPAPSTVVAPSSEFLLTPVVAPPGIRR
ncbi:hypothetical protein Tco_1248497 [Tanacetum coccineum]